MKNTIDAWNYPTSNPLEKTSDHVGAKFGRLTVSALPKALDADTPQPHLPHNMRQVSCSCGNDLFANVKFAKDLEALRTVSCGCLTNEKRPAVGTKFGKLTLVGKAKGLPGVSVFDCECKTRCRADLKLVRAGEIRGCHSCMRKGSPGTKAGVFDRVFFDGVSMAEHARRRNIEPLDALKAVLRENT